MKRVKAKRSPHTTQLQMLIPAELHERLVYLSLLPAHQDWGGTLESLVTRVLEEGSVGIAIHYERFEDKKPITAEVRRRAFGKPKARTSPIER